MVYAAGSHDDKVYFTVAGLVKLVMQSPEGKECLLELYAAGDFFGECCLTGASRTETAIAMDDTVLKQVTRARFLALMLENGWTGDFASHLAVRLAEQRQVITDFATTDCEHRLAVTLLRLFRKLRTAESRGLGQRISHLELSQIVGTTRPRVSELMRRFRDWGLIEISSDSRILVSERRLQLHVDTRAGEPRLSAAAS
jgi:CRP-like cAMP-binding protein